MNALQKAELDVKAMDYGSARRRLMSHLASVGYRPEVCQRLAEICRMMHDPVEAGRWFLLCEHVDTWGEECIARFLSKHGDRMSQVFSELPQQVRLAHVDDYPPVVAARLKGLGFTGKPNSRTSPRSAAPGSKLMAIGCLLVIVVLAAIVILKGIAALGGWIAGRPLPSPQGP